MKIWIAVVVLFFGGTYFAIDHYISDIDVNKYKNIKEVRKDKAIERGWVPAILPKSAYNIIEIHDLDTNRLYGRFYYKEKDETLLLQHLEFIEDTNDTYVWQDFLFRLDIQKNIVKYRNNPLSQ